MAGSKGSAKNDLKSLTRKLEAANKKKELLERDYAEASGLRNELLEAVHLPSHSGDSRMPQRIPNWTLNPNWNRWRAMLDYEQEKKEGWEAGQWDDDGDDDEEDQPDAQKLKRRWDSLCGRKQELVDARMKEKSAKNKSSLMQRITALDKKIVEVGKKRQSLKKNGHEVVAAKRRKIEEGDESDIDGEGREYSTEDEDTDDEYSTESEETEDEYSTEDDNTDDECSTEDDGRDQDSPEEDETDDESSTEDDDDDDGRKTWFALRKGTGLKYRMTAAEAKKLRSELWKEQQMAPERQKETAKTKEATKKMEQIGRKLFAIKEHISSLETLKRLAEGKC